MNSHCLCYKTVEEIESTSNDTIIKFCPSCVKKHTDILHRFSEFAWVGQVCDCLLFCDINGDFEGVEHKERYLCAKHRILRDYEKNKPHDISCICIKCDKVDDSQSFTFYEENKPSANDLVDCSLINLTEDMFQFCGETKRIIEYHQNIKE